MSVRQKITELAEPRADEVVCRAALVALVATAYAHGLDLPAKLHEDGAAYMAVAFGFNIAAALGLVTLLVIGVAT